MKRPNYYVPDNAPLGGFNRRAERRKDEVWVAERLADPSTRLYPVWRGASLVITGDDPQAPQLTARAQSLIAIAASHPEGEVIFLGETQGVAHFALELSHVEAPQEHADLTDFVNGGGADFIDLKMVGSHMRQQEGAVLAYARGMAHWHTKHRFCGVCGAPTVSAEAGFMRKCTNADCGTPHFPRSDPAVIMLVTRDGGTGDPLDDMCLMGRSHRFTDMLYSTLAGFVEPGENLEQAVIRELHEEAGIVVENVQYASSQPWPFPASLMLGFYADAVTTEIEFDKEELADCRWFSRRYLKTQRKADGIMIPPRHSIARRLIEDWLLERWDD